MLKGRNDDEFTLNSIRSAADRRPGVPACPRQVQWPHCMLIQLQVLCTSPSTSSISAPRPSPDDGGARHVFDATAVGLEVLDHRLLRAEQFVDQPLDPLAPSLDGDLARAGPFEVENRHEEGHARTHA